VVHVVDTNGNYALNREPTSYVSLYSSTPDFITFTVTYGCLSFKDTDAGWSKLEIPSLGIESDLINGSRITRVLVDTKNSKRWALAINTNLVCDFSFEVDSEELVSTGEKSSVDGWHIIQFSGGKESPTKFYLKLIWAEEGEGNAEGSPLLLKLRADDSRITPKTARVLEKLPPWCSLFGKSTHPHNFAFLTSLPADFKAEALM
ncbi:hypothetical protein HPP92_028503, partial [Vanilla planifolia]